MDKLELLRRPADGPKASVRVIPDASMSLKFTLPKSYLQARQAALSGAKTPQNVTQSAPKRTQDSELAQDASWEDRDWESNALDSTAKAEKNSGAEIEDWQDETPELPDDFPRLIVNLTKVQNQHFPPERDEEPDMVDVFKRVKATLQEHFSTLAEALFEQKLCFHCSYGTSRGMMDGLHAAYPEDTFAMMDYPTLIDEVPLHEYLHVLSYPSQWKSVEYLKDCLRRCSRDIRWKRDVITELELLAEQEHAQYTEQQQNLSDEIDELTRLRDSFRDKLEKMASQEGKSNGQYLMLRKLEDIETRLMTLLDQYLQEPELLEEECYSAFGNPGGEAGPSTGMNVLDMVIAMIFGRLPRDFSQKTTSEEHFQMLFDHHIHILRLWKKDFGRLPPKQRAAPPQPDGSDAHNMPDSSDEEHEVPYASEDEMAEQVEALLVQDDDYEHFDAPPLTVDDWETVDAEDDDRNDEDSGFKKVQHDDLDGYGADFDSEESDDEDELAEAAALAKLQQQKLEQSTSAKSSKPARPRRRRVKRSKHSKRLEKLKAERRESDREEDAVPFQPFACTGAVGLLRLAKENEMF